MPDYIFIFIGIIVGAAVLIVAMFRVREIVINWVRGRDPDYHSEQKDDSDRLAKRDRLKR